MAMNYRESGGQKQSSEKENTKMYGTMRDTCMEKEERSAMDGNSA